MADGKHISLSLKFNNVHFLDLFTDNVQIYLFIKPLLKAGGVILSSVKQTTLFEQKIMKLLFSNFPFDLKLLLSQFCSAHSNGRDERTELFLWHTFFIFLHLIQHCISLKSYKCYKFTLITNEESHYNNQTCVYCPRCMFIFAPVF